MMVSFFLSPSQTNSRENVVFPVPNVPMIHVMLPGMSPPSEHIVQTRDTDLDPFVHMITRMLLTSKPLVSVIRTANFTRSRSSRWGITPRNFSKYITRCRRAPCVSSQRNNTTASAISASSRSRDESRIPLLKSR